MSGLHVVGAALLAIPFVVLYVIVAKELGAIEALVIFGVTAVVTAVICLGSWLVTS